MASCSCGYVTRFPVTNDFFSSFDRLLATTSTSQPHNNIIIITYDIVHAYVGRLTYLHVVCTYYLSLCIDLWNMDNCTEL